MVLVLAFLSGDFILQHPIGGSTRRLCLSFVPSATRECRSAIGGRRWTLLACLA